MKNFTTSKDAKIIDITGLVQIELAESVGLQIGDNLTSGTVLSFSEGSEITLIFADGSQQKLSSEFGEIQIADVQSMQQDTLSAVSQEQNQVSNQVSPDNEQADIDAIQALIESGDEVDVPDTAAGGLTNNEGTSFVTLARDGNQLLAGAGYDTTELDNAAGIAEVPTLVDPIDNSNALPEAVDDTFSMDENTQLTGALLGNDDLGDQATTVTAFDGTSSNGGEVAVDGSGNFTYTPVEDFVGTDTFSYTITDADGDASTATVTVNIANVNQLPEAVDDEFAMDENTQLAGTLLGNDDLGDEDTTVTDFDSTSVNGGAVTVDAEGNFTYTPVTDFVGSDSFTYTITDADGDTSTATVTVNIANVNQLPEAVDDTFEMEENTQLTGTLLGNDDLGDEETTVTEFDSTSTNGGAVTVDAEGNFTYTPVTDFVGSDTFTYTITDADGDTSTATVTVNIANVNNLPEAVDDVFDINENTPLSGSLLGNDDLGDEATTVTSFDSTSTNGGNVSVDAEGNFTYTPVTDFVGSDTFTYTITDADGDTSTATVTVNVANVNLLPDAVNDNFRMDENTQLTGTLLGNDDLGDNPTTVTSFDSSSANGGTVNVNGSGNFTYTPASNFVGTDTFTYTITDENGDSSTATVSVAVLGANLNAIPDAVNDSFNVDENSELTGSVIGNDDLGDNPTTVTAFDATSVNGGTVNVNPDGSFSYTPASNFVGADTFTYTITDADGDTDTATVTVNVANVNLLPDAVNDSFNVDENTELTGSVIGNDDLGDNPTTVTAFDATSVNGGTVNVNPDGSFSYTPASNFVGADTFTYTITDADGDTDTATVTVNVANVNLLPDAVNDSFNVDENTELTGSVIGNDDLGDNPTTVTAFDATSVNGGTVNVNPDGSFSYTPASNFVGADTFTYTITDADGDTDTATVTVNVANVNLLPDAVNDSFNVDENTELTGSVIGNDDLGDNPTTVTAFDATSVNGGTVNVNPDGSFSYTPASNFVGADTFTYTITDADGDTDTATVTVNVANVNLLPDAVNDSFNVDENTELTGSVIGNDDLGDNPTTVTAFDATSVNGGTVNVNPDGSFSYTPASNFVGADTFTYTITDADGDTDTATVTVNVANVNLLPDAVNDSFNVDENTELTGSVIGNDDLGDNPTTVTAFDATSVNGGTVNVNPDGSFSYTPARNFVGADTFTYTITDADGDTDTATVTVNVANVNLLPDAVNDSFNVDENTELTGSVIGNDDLGDNPTTVTAFDATSVNGGTVNVNPDGSFSYTPASNFVGADTFTYTITDADGDTDTATVTVNVANVNLLPDAVNDSFNVDENTELTGSVIGNDDLGDNPTTVTAFDATSVNGGTVNVNPDGSFSYTPASNFVGADTFTYTITDADGDTDTATVTVNVANVNLLPDAVNDSFNVDENTELTGSVIGNDDLGDNPTTVTAFDATSVNGGTVNVNPDGSFSYTPASNFVGADTFTYTITDADGDTDTATVTVNVANVNLLPDAVNDSFNVDENTELTGSVIGNDDLGDNPTTVTAFDATSVNGGTVNVNPDGSFSYTPASNFVGADTFTYTITDADGDTDTATVTVNVANVNAPPVAEDDIFSVDEGSSVSGNVITHNDGDGAVDTDGGDGGTLSVTHVNGVALVFDVSTGAATVAIKDGTLSIKADGSFTYNNSGYVLGTAPPSFNYTLSDGIDSDIGAVTINVIDYAPDAIDDVNYIQLTQLGDTDTANRNGVKGNVVTTGSTGDNADTSVDGFGTPIITQVAYNGSTFQFSDTVSSHAIDTGFGVLTINSSGAYNFVTPTGMQIPDADMNLVFTYTIQDGDVVNPEEDSADLTINIKKPVAPEPLSNELDLDFQQTSTTIDTTFDAKVALQADKLAFKFSPDLDGLSDILTEANTDGLETYLAAIGEDNSSKANIELTNTIKDSPLDDAKVLAKEHSDQEFSSSATVTNGLLEGGGTIISDHAAATSAPIAEFDSAELL